MFRGGADPSAEYTSVADRESPFFPRLFPPSFFWLSCIRAISISCFLFSLLPSFISLGRGATDLARQTRPGALLVLRLLRGESRLPEYLPCWGFACASCGGPRLYRLERHVGASRILDVAGSASVWDYVFTIRLLFRIIQEMGQRPAT